MIPLGDRPFLLRTNSYGMRSSREYPLTKPARRRRVVLLGDSYTVGWGVNNRDCYSELLESKHANLDVMNFALSGSGTDQQLLVYESIAKPFEADLYIFAPCTVNILRNEVKWMPLVRRSGVRAKPYFTLDEQQKLLLHNVPVPNVQLSEKEIAQPEALSVLDYSVDLAKIIRVTPEWLRWSDLFLRMSLTIRQTFHGYDSKDSKSWSLMRAILNRFIEQVEEKPVFIVPIPTYHHFAMDLDPTYLSRFYELHNPERNCFVIDVLPGFRQLSRQERKACRLEKDPHFSPQGHKIVAEAILRGIQERHPEILS